MKISVTQLRKIIREEIENVQGNPEMVTYELIYKKKFHPSLVRGDLARLARETNGEFTHDGNLKGTVTCPQKFEWVLTDREFPGSSMLQSFSKV